MIDNTVIHEIMRRLTNKESKAIFDDLLLNSCSYGAKYRFEKGNDPKPPNTPFYTRMWPQSSNWYKCMDEYYTRDTLQEKLFYKDVNQQAFPEKIITKKAEAESYGVEYTFDSHAYDTLLSYAEEYEKRNQKNACEKILQDLLELRIPKAQREEAKKIVEQPDKPPLASLVYFLIDRARDAAERTDNNKEAHLSYVFIGKVNDLGEAVPPLCFRRLQSILEVADTKKYSTASEFIFALLPPSICELISETELEPFMYGFHKAALRQNLYSALARDSGLTLSRIIKRAALVLRNLDKDQFYLAVHRFLDDLEEESPAERLLALSFWKAKATSEELGLAVLILFALLGTEYFPRFIKNNPVLGTA